MVPATVTAAAADLLPKLPDPEEAEDDRLYISAEDLLSFLDASPQDNSFHDFLGTDVGTTTPPQGVEEPKTQTHLLQSGEHPSSQSIPPYHFNASNSVQDTPWDCSFQDPQTYGNFTHACNPPIHAGSYNTSLLPNRSYDCQPCGSDQKTNRSFPETTSHCFTQTGFSSDICLGSGDRLGVGQTSSGESSLEMESGQGINRIPFPTPPLYMSGNSSATLMSVEKQEDFYGFSGDFHCQGAEGSSNIEGNTLVDPSKAADLMFEVSRNCFRTTSSAADSCNGPSTVGASTHVSMVPSIQHFASRSVDTASLSLNENNFGLNTSQWLNTERQEHSVAQENEIVQSPDMAIMDIEGYSVDVNYHKIWNSDGSTSTESSTVAIDGNTACVDFLGSGYATKLHPPEQVIQNYLKNESKDKWSLSCHNRYDLPNKVTHSNALDGSTIAVDDSDIYVLDDISAPSRKLSSVDSLRITQWNGVTKPRFSGTMYSEETHTFPKAYDERLTFRTALQDLSQETSEANPPDGVLAVPLLRHQRIALSWMVQKETSSLNCSGGILADDQGLGKTVSTIALILSERSPSTTKGGDEAKKPKVETFTLDDDDEAAGPHATEHSKKGFEIVKGRPPAGTLVVCPTSVLRQWASELQNKVTTKGDLSFLVYHGSNRTKDPSELSKYDVVLTTYSIVSMEVPKEMFSAKDDQEMGFSSKKRKDPPSTCSTLLDSTARPLSRVAWFRVILDEAQTIKNHRTRVAKACCGLRAKRRWCLSGTPIQNSIDDLYSYFRFLRYEPYAAYTSFCSAIKTPVSKNPDIGYKKLQAVLRTIMLRRIKGTCIDGQPIIDLPPKSITLKKVDFSPKERDFYSKLEAESREKFKVYAAEGTVKKNYVNILLMLLRLRQACDHPCLVRADDFSSVWVASQESAKELSKDKLLHLLDCLGASLAICCICRDPPEDAVVTICGHVFCNQCVSEWVTGDESHCPSSHCKVKLNVASIFPKSSLESALMEMSVDKIANGASNKPGDFAKTSKSIDSYDSPKIRAAIEILQSVPRCKGGSTFEISNNDTTAAHESEKSCSEKCFDGHTIEKAIVFSQWTGMLDLFEAKLKDSCLCYRRFDGTMSVAARDKAIQDFNTLPEVTVMIMSLKAASLGLNMVAACHVLLLDLWWNPTTEDQAIDRAHRIGQTRPVTVSRLTVKDTVEDRILALQEKKRKMVASAFGEDETGDRQSRLTVEDLQYLFMA